MKGWLFAFFVACSNLLTAQELFPSTEPASNIPKGVLGIRLANEFYDELGKLRSWQAYRFMFGLSSKLMIMQTFSFSNHHGKNLPAGFIANDGNIGLHTHGTDKGADYPYLFETLNINIKYRFYSNDAEKKHFRLAAWLEAAGGNEPHDEAEPSMMGDNAGISAGIIATQLINKLALSSSVSFILPAPYNEKLTGISIQYGKAINYTFSAGYLLLPFSYKSYKQTNLNLYAEFIGKIYDGAVIKKNNTNILIEGAPSLEKGNYIELRPGFQFIFKSNLRIDITSSVAIYNQSYTRFYPTFHLNIQRYFFFK